MRGESPKPETSNVIEMRGYGDCDADGGLVVAGTCALSAGKGAERFGNRLERELQNTGFKGNGATFPNDLLRHALSVHSSMWPEVRVELGEKEPDWITAEAFFSNDAEIEDYLRYKGSLRNGGDRKTCAATMMLDYGNTFSIATVYLLVGFGVVPNLDPRLFAMKFHTEAREHDDTTHGIRRAHVRFLSSDFWTDNAESAAHTDKRGLLEHDGLFDLYRRSVEDHFAPLVEALFRKTGLGRGALWRLVGDSIAGHFLEAGRRFGRFEAAKASAMTILKQPGSPLNNRQLHYFELTLRDAQDQELISWTFRGRGGCCRFYKVAEGTLCETCVLKNSEERDADLLEIMRRRFAELTGRAV